MSSSTDQFYHDLKPAPSLKEAFHEQYTRPLPADWSIVITDIIGSTKAIEEGRYKDVNMAGGLAAMALSNVFKTLEFPFIFGGDGTTFLIPNTIRETAEAVLIDTARKVKELFTLDLRVGIVPESVIREDGFEVRVGKVIVSPHYIQAVISGEGVQYAESLVKHETGFTIPAHSTPGIEADFFGFSCRWKDIPSQHGETVALILHFKDEQEDKKLRHLNEALTMIEKYYGSEDEYHPIQEQSMRFAYSKKSLGREAAARLQTNHGLRFLLLRWRILGEVIVARVAEIFSLPIRYFHYRVDKIKWYNKMSSDYKKFDGMLKIVLSGTAKAREDLLSVLDAWYKEGRLNYGIHVSDRAILTCLLHASSKQEVHFVDAADGGYAMAAKMLKNQMLAKL